MSDKKLPPPDEPQPAAVEEDGEESDAAPAIDEDAILLQMTIDGLKHLISTAEAKLEAQADEVYHVEVEPAFGEHVHFSVPTVEDVLARLRELSNGRRVTVRVILGRQLSFSPDMRYLLTPSGSYPLASTTEATVSSLSEAVFGGTSTETAEAVAGADEPSDTDEEVEDDEFDVTEDEDGDEDSIG